LKLRKDRGEVAVEREVRANQNPEPHGHREAHGFVVRVSDAEKEPDAGRNGFEFDDAEKLHAVVRNRVLVFDDTDVPVRERFHDCLDDFDVRDRFP
jgi:hypothetical protein